MSLCLFCFSSYQFLFHIFCYFLRKDIKKIPISANYSWIICANGMKKSLLAQIICAKLESF